MAGHAAQSVIIFYVTEVSKLDSYKGFFGIAERKINEKKVQVTDREKTLIDCADRPDLGGGIIQLSQVLENEYAQIDWSKIEDYFERWGAEPW